MHFNVILNIYFEYIETRIIVTKFEPKSCRYQNAKPKIDTLEATIKLKLIIKKMHKISFNAQN